MVAHSTHPYLLMGQSWIYHQIAFLRRWVPVVLTRRTVNVETFPVERIHALHARSRLRVGLEKLAAMALGYLPLHRRALGRERARLLHSHGGLRGIADAALARAMRLPHVVSFYGADIWQGSRDPLVLRGFRRLFASAACFLVEGPAMRRKVISLGCPPGKVRVHHLGIAPEKVRFLPRTPHADGEVRFLLAGRSLEKKGHLHGVEAFARLAARHPAVRLVLMTWGDGPEADAVMDPIRRIIAAQGLGERVEIVGQQPYAEYLESTRRCHVFVNPSVHAVNGDAEGGFPVTLTEMLASGMPVVASDHCDAAEIVRDGETGLLAPERDPAALAEKLEWLLGHPGDWRRLAENARRLVEREYDARVQAGRAESIYDELTGG
ncbi:MAG: glycosyltransferase [Limisphaerales bacterium]